MSVNWHQVAIGSSYWIQLKVDVIANESRMVRADRRHFCIGTVFNVPIFMMTTIKHNTNHVAMNDSGNIGACLLVTSSIRVIENCIRLKFAMRNNISFHHQGYHLEIFASLRLRTRRPLHTIARTLKTSPHVRLYSTHITHSFPAICACCLAVRSHVIHFHRIFESYLTIATFTRECLRP